MSEKIEQKNIEKKFLTTFRLCLLIWVIIANIIVHQTGFAYGWLIFISNIMMFTMEGNNRDKFISVEVGGLVGLVFTVGMVTAMVELTPVIGDFMGFLIPLSVVLFVLIMLHPYAPKVLNNVGFAYLTCACIDVEGFMGNMWVNIGVFAGGSLIFNGVCLLILKGLEKAYFKA